LQRKPDDQPASNLPGMEDVRLFLGAWLSLSRQQRDFLAWRIFNPVEKFSQFFAGQRNARQRAENLNRIVKKRHEILARLLTNRPKVRGRT
jgi:hypothetical protein